MKRFIISRTDSIGDVILTLPMAAVLKKTFPKSEIYFLGRNYTSEIIKACCNIDSFIDYDDLRSSSLSEQVAKIKDIHADAFIHVFPTYHIARLAFKAKIRFRIGTTNRWYHWLYCNNIFTLSRRNSALHEAQLNLKLLKPFNINRLFELNEIQDYYGLRKIENLNPEFERLLSKDKINLILHPKSKGSSREWGINNFKDLISLLQKDKYNIFITGTAEERELIKNYESGITNKANDSYPDYYSIGELKNMDKTIFNYENVKDLTGKFSLSQLISFINSADAIIAGSTGPLHIAAALDKCAIGLYPPMRPIHPGRWAPIGKFATYLVKDKNCNKCRHDHKCECIESISPDDVKEMLDTYIELYYLLSKGRITKSEEKKVI